MNKIDVSNRLGLAVLRGSAVDVAASLRLGPENSVVESALATTASLGYADCLALLIPECDPSAGGSYALRRAVEAGKEKCVKMLAPHSDAGEALSIAIRKRRLGCLELLLPLVREISDEDQDQLVMLAEISNVKLGGIISAVVNKRLLELSLDPAKSSGQTKSQRL